MKHGIPAVLLPGDRFGMSLARIGQLPRDHPFFLTTLDENPRLLREHGLVHVVAGAIDEFRQTPKLMAKSVARVPGRDFRLPTQDECNELVAYMLSDLVADRAD